MEQTKLIKSRLFIKIRELKVDGVHKKILLLLSSILVSRLFFGDIPLLIFFPMLLLSTLMGYSNLIFTCIGILIGGLTISPNYLLLYSLGVCCFLTLSILLKFLPFSYANRLAVCLFISDIIFRITFSATNGLPIDLSILAMSIISLLLGYFAIETFKAYTIKNKAYYPPSLIVFIGVMITLSILGLPSITLSFDYKASLLILTLLLLARYTGSLIGTMLTLISSSLAFFILGLTTNDFLLLSLTLAFTSMIADRGKIVMGLVYTTSIYFISSYLMIDQNIALLLLYGLPFAIFLLTPTNLFKLESKMPNPEIMLNLQQKQFNSLQVALSNKIKSISDLFNEVSMQLKENENIKALNKELEVVYRHLCINCPKSQVCFQSNTNNLVALMHKAIEDNLNDNEDKYIYNTCLKPAKYLAIINDYKQQFYTQYKYSQEYSLVKQMVYFQLDGIAKVLNDYANDMQYYRKLNQDELEEKIKASLEMLQIDAIYVKVVKDYLSFPLLELAVNVKDEKQVEEILPYLEEKIGCNIELTSKKQNSFDNYFIIMGLIKPHYQLTYGIGQLSHDKDCSGDSYSCFNYKNKVVLALSDGMGVGKAARKESDATLSLLKKMLETDMDDNKAIETINTLLKLKNRIETYATLDFLTFEKNTGVVRFIKNGAPTSYLIRNDELISIDNYSLPIGIVNEITPFDYKTKVEMNDLIVLVSDGLIEVMGDSLPKLIMKYKNLHPQTIVKNIISRCQETTFNDDISIIAARVEKSLI
jgi:stage II sporulation protein E